MTKIAFSMYSGNTKTVTMPVKSEQFNTAIDLTGSTGEFTIAEYVNPKPEHVICSGPVQLIDAQGGIVKFVIEAEMTVGHSGIFPLDVKITFPDGKIQTAFFGWVQIKAVVND